MPISFSASSLLSKTAPILNFREKLKVYILNRINVQPSSVWEENFYKKWSGSCETKRKDQLSRCLTVKVAKYGLLQHDFEILSAIIEAESQWRQFTDDGVTVLRGRINPKDVGLCQINEKYHLEESRKHEEDIYTAEGNLDYCVRLYKEKGTSPWDWSKDNWQKSLQK